MVEAALGVGAPAFTGEIKTAGFHTVLDSWRPDAIVSCCFGQVIDATIIERPAYARTVPGRRYRAGPPDRVA